MDRLIFGIAFWILLGSCNSSSDLVSSQTKEVQFQLVDSLVVESLLSLYLVGKSEESGQYLFKDKFVNEVFLTDSKGKVLAFPLLRGEGPDQVATPWEIGFAGNEIAIKEFSAESKIHFFDVSFKKTHVSAPLSAGMNSLEVAPTRNGLSYVEFEDKRLLIGSDANVISPDLMAAGQQNPGFYAKAKSGFTIDIKSREVQNFNIYPDAWQPKKDGDWVGQSRPFLAVTSKNNVIGILPKIGDQLFFFQLKGNGLIPTGETLVNHPDRKRDLAFDPEDESLLYPSFFDLKAGGSFFLIHFYTEVPKDRYLPMKAQGTNNAKNPEFLELLRETRRSKYILVDERGNQAPVLSLPIEGQVHYIDADDIIYIKPVTKDERDYNVFYRYRVKM